MENQYCHSQTSALLVLHQSYYTEAASVLYNAQFIYFNKFSLFIVTNLLYLKMKTVT